MVRANLKGVFPESYKILRDGTRRRYWYHPAAKKRLRGDPGSAEFMVDYAAAEARIQTPADDGATFNGLARQYTLSAEFQGTLTAPVTQSEYRRLLKTAEQEFRDLPAAALMDWQVREDFLTWREKVARTSGNREADHRLSAISAMLTWAVGRGRLPVNHLKGFKRLVRHRPIRNDLGGKNTSRRFSLSLHRRCNSRWCSPCTPASGREIFDGIAWSAYDGECITLRQSRSQRRGLKLPSPSSCPARRRSKRRALITRLRRAARHSRHQDPGVAFTKRYLAAQWDAARKAAGIKRPTLCTTSAARP